MAVEKETAAGVKESAAKDAGAKDAGARETAGRRATDVKEAVEAAKAGHGEESQEPVGINVGEAVGEMMGATQRTADAGQRQMGQAGERMMESGEKAMESAGNQASRIAEDAARAGRELTDRTARNMDAFIQAQTAVADGFQGVWREWVTYTQGSVQRWADQMQSLVRARTLHELVNTQTDIVRVEMEHLLKSSQRMSEVATRAANGAARRMSDRIEQGQGERDTSRSSFGQGSSGQSSSGQGSSGKSSSGEGSSGYRGVYGQDDGREATLRRTA